MRCFERGGTRDGTRYGRWYDGKVRWYGGTVRGTVRGTVDGTVVRYDGRLDVLSLYIIRAENVVVELVEPTSTKQFVIICFGTLCKSRQPNSHGRSDYLL